MIRNLIRKFSIFFHKKKNILKSFSINFIIFFIKFEIFFYINIKLIESDKSFYLKMI